MAAFSTNKIKANRSKRSYLFTFFCRFPHISPKCPAPGWVILLLLPLPPRLSVSHHSSRCWAPDRCCIIGALWSNCFVMQGFAGDDSPLLPESASASPKKVKIRSRELRGTWRRSSSFSCFPPTLLWSYGSSGAPFSGKWVALIERCYSPSEPYQKQHSNIYDKQTPIRLCNSNNLPGGNRCVGWKKSMITTETTEVDCTF